MLVEPGKIIVGSLIAGGGSEGWRALNWLEAVLVQCAGGKQ